MDPRREEQIQQLMIRERILNCNIYKVRELTNSMDYCDREINKIVAIEQPTQYDDAIVYQLNKTYTHNKEKIRVLQDKIQYDRSIIDKMIKDLD